MTATLVPEAAPDTLQGNGIGAAVSGTVTAAVGVAGAVLGLTAVSGSLPAVRLPWLLPLSGVDLAVNRVGGFFMALT
ncbi:hypothetical protein V5264_32245, partial [Pseudomonas citronellolis]